MCSHPTPPPTPHCTQVNVDGLVAVARHADVTPTSLFGFPASAATGRPLGDLISAIGSSLHNAEDVSHWLDSVRVR